MEKILVCVSVPAVRKTFDLFVPQDIPIRVLTDEIARGTEDLSRGKYAISGKEMLIAKNPDRLLYPECTLGDYGIADGAMLMLL